MIAAATQANKSTIQESIITAIALLQNPAGFLSLRFIKYVELVIKKWFKNPWNPTPLANSLHLPVRIWREQCEILASYQTKHNSKALRARRELEFE
jgi:hypothetical protein